MAAPHVAGIAALVYSINSTLSVDEVETILKDSARAFPVTGNALDCDTVRCGSGLADAAAAISVGNAAPTAGFTFSTSDLTADFSDASSDSDGSIVGWSWNFGDGTNSSAQNPSHDYAAAGDYTVTLKVTDNDGATDAASHSVTVTEPQISRSSGGGSSFSLLTLLLLGAYLPIGFIRRRWFV